MVRHWLIASALVLTLLPNAVAAQTPSGGWRVYTPADGLREWPSYSIAADGTGGVWVGHISGGRAIGRQGGLTHIRADGTSQQFASEPFTSCSSVDMLAAAPGGGAWMWMSGYHDYGSNDYQGRCIATYGVGQDLPGDQTGQGVTVALGYVAPNGAVQMVPREQMPTTLTTGLGVDAAGRVWAGSNTGAVYRTPDGTWRSVGVWESGSTSALSVVGSTVLLGATNGAVATLRVNDDNSVTPTVLPRPTEEQRFPVSSLTRTTQSIDVIIGRKLYSFVNAVWQAVDIPISDRLNPYDPLYGQRIVAVGDSLWIGSPYYGLHRRAASQWTAYPADRTPMPGNAVYALAAASNTTLLVATEQGAVQFDVNTAVPDTAVQRRAFDALWQRSNRSAQGSWVWGPRAWAERYEPYTNATSIRFTRYYDKARMEVTNPNADTNAAWFVTNGLLVTEMVRGLAQYSDDPARSTCPFYARNQPCPSNERVAGDIGPDAGANMAPGYGAFAAFLNGAERRSGTQVGTTLQRNDISGFTPVENATLASEATTLDAYDDITRHNIPRVFWNYMRAQPVDWLFTFGRPITEAYWVRAVVGGTERWVMVQLYERRTLTYTPTNPADWQAEMGNVGQHYFSWRYRFYDQPPWTSGQ